MDRMVLFHDGTDHGSGKAMQFPRVTIRRLSLLVAALAAVFGILTGLQRRGERFRHLAAEYSSAIHAVYFADVNGKDGTALTVAAAEYHDDLSLMYKAAADRPWLPIGSEPPPPEGVRAFWIAHAAVKTAYPSVALGDYNACITTDDRDGPPEHTVWAVRYRRRDNRSGMNVFVDDPVEIELHGEGAPLDPPNPK